MIRAVRRAGDAGGVDELALAQGQELGPHQRARPVHVNRPSTSATLHTPVALKAKPATAAMSSSGMIRHDVGDPHQHGVDPARRSSRRWRRARRRSCTASTASTKMTTSVCCTPRIVSANMSRAVLVVEPERVVAEVDAGAAEPGGPQRHRRAWSAAMGTRPCCSRTSTTRGSGPSRCSCGQQEDADEQDQRHHRPLVAEEATADDLALAEAGDLLLLEGLLVGWRGHARRVGQLELERVGHREAGDVARARSRGCGAWS